MTGTFFVHRLLIGILALAVFSVAGCASRYSTETIIGGRPVAYRSSTERSVLRYVVNQDIATFAVGSFEFTIDRTQVTWGQGEVLTLPSNWRRVDFIDRGSHIVVQVNGRPYGEIRPAA